MSKVPTLFTHMKDYEKKMAAHRKEIKESSDARIKKRKILESIPEGHYHFVNTNSESVSKKRR